jgi:ADP-heptose:LPS heptosyltransferase
VTAGPRALRLDPARRARLRSRLLAWAPGARRRVAALDPHRPPAVPPAARLLVVRPDHLGDLLFAGPALARLRAAWPTAEITLLVGPWAHAVAERLPGVDHVRTVAFPWFDRQARRSALGPYRRLAGAAGPIRQAHYDVAVILRADDWWGAWLAALARVPVRVGHNRPGVRPFLTHALPEPAGGGHAVMANIALVGGLVGDGRPADPGLDGLAFCLGPPDHAAAAALLGGLATRPLAIHPGSGAQVKRWRSGGWAEAVAALTAPGEAIVLTGGPAEAAVVAQTAAVLGRPVVNLAGATPLATLGAVYARCRLVLGPDSGPLHLAVAVGTPTVHLFGPADPARFGPWGPGERHRVVASDLPCVPCGRLDWPDPGAHPCVRTLSVAAVVAAARNCGASSTPL